MSKHKILWRSIVLAVFALAFAYIMFSRDGAPAVNASGVGIDLNPGGRFPGARVRGGPVLWTSSADGKTLYRWEPYTTTGSFVRNPGDAHVATYQANDLPDD